MENIEDLLDQSDWIDLILDKDMFIEITSHHKALSSPLNIQGIDGFYFIDSTDHAVLIDNHTLQVMTYKPSEKEEIVYNRKISVLDIEGTTIYYQNKILIKNGKKFYKIISQKKNKILNKLFNNKYLKKLIFYGF